MSKYIQQLVIGEIGKRNVDVREACTALSYDLSANMVSQISFTVYDENHRMHDNNYFMIGRRVVFNNLEFEIAAVGLTVAGIDSVEITARSLAMQNMRRDKGSKNFGSISPSGFATLMAQKFGLGVFVEPSAVDGQIVREYNEKNEESSYDVLARLARELEFKFFEANGTLFFASDKYLIDNQPNFTISVPSEAGDTFFSSKTQLRRSIDGKNAATFSTSLIKNDSSVTIFPGTGVKFKGRKHFGMTFMVDQVKFDASHSGLVSISGTAPEDSDDMICDIQTFQQGSRGECVKRIQQAVNAGADGIWGPQTQRQVKKFQTLNGLTADGIFDADDWAKLKTNYTPPLRVAVTQPDRDEDKDLNPDDMAMADPYIWFDGDLSGLYGG